MKLSSPRRPGYLLLAGILTVASVASVAFAAMLMIETFGYPDGTLVPNGGWSIHSGLATDKPIQVIAGETRVEQSAGSGQDVNRTFPVQATNAKTWACFKLRVPSIAPGGGAPTFSTGDYFAHFRPQTLVNNFRARVHVIAPVAGGNYSVGITAVASGTSPIVPWTSDLSFDQTYTIVISYDAVTGTSTLYVNPTNEASPSISSTHATGVGEDMSGFALRQSAVQTIYEFVDDIVVGQSFPDLDTKGLVPGMLPLGAAALASLLFGAGALVTFRRARTA